jgi:hypothetical protein
MNNAQAGFGNPFFSKPSAEEQMAFSIKLWQASGDNLQEIGSHSLDDEQRLETWIATDPSILGMDVLLIGRQVTTINRGRIDLLGVDSDANVVIFELKRDMTPREVVAQALDYASWIKTLSYENLDAEARKYRGKSLKQAFQDHFGFEIPGTVNANHSIVIVASQLDDSSERIVQYLAETYQVPINALFFTFFRSGASEFLGRAWLSDPQELRERTTSPKQTPWSGYYFVNVGESDHRNWDDCRKYGFLSAGQGDWYSSGIKRLSPGDRVFAYMRGLGYVGYGTVTRPAVMAKDFVVEGKGKLLSLPLKQPRLAENKNDPLLSEWVVAIDWHRTFPREEAKSFKGIFANQNIVCQLRHPATVEFLRKEFGIPESAQ